MLPGRKKVSPLSLYSSNDFFYNITFSKRRSFLMAKKLYVGNLSYGIGDDQLKQFFEPHGTVVSATVIMDRETGRSKGFGFVEMSTDEEAQAGISAYNGKEIEGRTLTVNEARPKAEGGSRGGGGGGGGYAGKRW